jgi:hypothetical protein
LRRPTAHCGDLVNTGIHNSNPKAGVAIRKIIPWAMIADALGV